MRRPHAGPVAAATAALPAPELGAAPALAVSFVPPTPLVPLPALPGDGEPPPLAAGELVVPAITEDMGAGLAGVGAGVEVWAAAGKAAGGWGGGSGETNSGFRLRRSMNPTL